LPRFATICKQIEIEIEIVVRRPRRRKLGWAPEVAGEVVKAVRRLDAFRRALALSEKHVGAGKA
jgi:hypothetical protein